MMYYINYYLDSDAKSTLLFLLLLLGGDGLKNLPTKKIRILLPFADLQIRKKVFTRPHLKKFALGLAQP